MARMRALLASQSRASLVAAQAPSATPAAPVTDAAGAESLRDDPMFPAASLILALVLALVLAPRERCAFT
jgi:hypothetical protein